MSTHNIGFYEEIAKLSRNHNQIRILQNGPLLLTCISHSNDFVKILCQVNNTVSVFLFTCDSCEHQTLYSYCA